MDAPTPLVQPGVAPTRLQVALAIAIVKSKPQGITVRDYISQIRATLKPGVQLAAKEGHLHLDNIAYWKARFEEAQRRCNDLEDRNVQLQRANDALSSRPDSEGNRDSSPSTRKRKGAATRSNRSAKVARLSPEASDISVDGDRDIVTGNQNAFDSLGEIGNSHFSVEGADERTKAGQILTQKLYVVHMQLKKGNADPKALCLHLVEVARAIGSNIATIPSNYDWLMLGGTPGKAPLTSNKSELLVIVQASARAFTSLTVALKKTANGVNVHLPGLVIFECVKMFKTIFDSISESARLVVRSRSENKSKSTNRTPASSVTKDMSPFRAIAQLLNALMSALEKNDRHHREIFEGLLYILISRISDILYYCTFDRHRSANIEADITAEPAKDEKTNASERQLDEMAIRLEARCLVPILERAIGLAPYYVNAPLSSGSTANANRRTSNQNRASIPKRLPTASKVALNRQAMDKLQRTLVSCMFGEECDEFSDVLRMPATLGSMPSIPSVRDENVSDWFSGEVWRLVGWDLLSNPIEF